MKKPLGSEVCCQGQVSWRTSRPPDEIWASRVVVYCGLLAIVLDTAGTQEALQLLRASRFIRYQGFTKFRVLPGKATDRLQVISKNSSKYSTERFEWMLQLPDLSQGGPMECTKRLVPFEAAKKLQKNFQLSRFKAAQEHLSIVLSYRSVLKIGVRQ